MTCEDQICDPGVALYVFKAGTRGYSSVPQAPCNTRSQDTAAQIRPPQHPGLPRWSSRGFLLSLRETFPSGSLKDPRSTLRTKARCGWQSWVWVPSSRRAPGGRPSWTEGVALCRPDQQ